MLDFDGGFGGQIAWNASVKWLWAGFRWQMERAEWGSVRVY